MENHDSIYIDGTYYQTSVTEKYRRRKAYVPKAPNQLRAVIPGKIYKINVSAGQVVQSGENLIILEAMKMQNTLTAPVAGRVEGILVKEGQNVIKDELLLTIEQ